MPLTSFAKLARVALGLTVCLVAAAALAQIPGLPAKTDAAAAAAQTVTIPIADIAQRADEDEAFIQEVIGRSSADAKADSLQQQLALIRRKVNDIAVKAQGSRLDTMTLSNLEALDRYLDFLARELRRWQTEQQAALRPLSTDAAKLVQRGKLWQDTRATIAGSAVPALVQRIDLLLGDFEQAERAVSQPLAQRR